MCIVAIAVVVTVMAIKFSLIYSNIEHGSIIFSDICSTS